MATAARPESARPLPTLTLDDLAAMGDPQLRELYGRARLPESLHALDGAPKGRMLALSGLGRGRALDLLARASAASWFPWDGKSFSALDDTRGTGINRTSLLGDVFRFETRIAASAIDGRPAVYLDYEQPDNPWFIQRIWDEVREVSPGLFFGPAMWKRKGKAPALVLWFAVDHG